MCVEISKRRVQSRPSGHTKYLFRLHDVQARARANVVGRKGVTGAFSMANGTPYGGPIS